MPTVSAQARSPEPEPHRYREVAQSFGTDAERYDRTRPSYPEALVAAIVAASPGKDVVDVGCGTGIAARQFRAAGCQVLGVDVDERMAELARRSGLAVEVSAFETWDPAGRAFDAVVAAQTWHWVDPVAGAAKAAEVLRPGGRLALFWNVGQPAPDITAALSAAHARVLPDLANFSRAMSSAMEAYSVMFTKAADGMRAVGAFGEPEQWRFDWERSYTRAEWLDLMPTQGGYTRLPQAELDELLAGVGAAIDAAGGSFAMHYAAVAVTASRTDTT